MLVRQNGTSFSTGRSRFNDRAEGSDSPTAKIFVKIEPHSFGLPILAQLDTGAAWSILDIEVAMELSLLNGGGQPIEISTRKGLISGWLERTQIDILADEGATLSVQATVFVSPHWRWGNFIGYCGLLERVRFAVDPSDNSFYFGSM